NLRLGVVGHGTGWQGLAHNDIADAGGNYAIMQNSAGVTLLNAAGGQYMDFRIGNSGRARLTAAGDMGVGVTAPSAKLHVGAHYAATVL
ncbi:hypothetical protein C8024_00875, partial [Sphingopyxis sp. BSNA05]|uniref:hypothetical protein n=1 Tax=Sphingopyxis sp. BSNA05 TaxID=1236614 RepID=UPI001564203D